MEDTNILKKEIKPSSGRSVSIPESSPSYKDIGSKIQGQFNEEKWTRISAKDVSISRFKLLESILEEVFQEDKAQSLKNAAKEHLNGYDASLSARYFLGMLALKENSPEDLHYLKQLLDQFQELSKWAVVNYLCDKMLDQSENRAVLRAKSNALEKLGKTKEAIPILEKLAQIDRRNPDIAFKYADAVISDDLDKGIQFYKQSAEIYAKNLQFDKLKISWTRIVDLVPEDFSFYRKIERILSGHRQKEVLADLYIQLVHHYIKQGALDTIISLCKKILECNPNYSRFKNELLKAYREKYKDHSLLEDFIRYSGLLNTRKTITSSIQNFETNIVFDKDNYVFHRSWGVGKTTSINTEEMIVDFKDKKAHKMNIQMALKSLKPLKEGHFLALQYEQPQQLSEDFENDITKFFKILLSSFGGSISLSALRPMICEKYIPEKDWSKWWSKTRNEILRDNLIGVSPQKKDIIELRESPITQSEKYIEKFQGALDLEEKISIATEAQKESSDMTDFMEYMIPFFKESLKSIDTENRIQSLILLEMIGDYLKEEDKIVEESVRTLIIKEMKEFSIEKAVKFGSQLKTSDVLRKYIKLLKTYHANAQEIYLQFLFKVRVKYHKLLIADLIAEKKWDFLNQFFSQLCKKASTYPDIFLSSFRALVYKHWEIPNIVLENHALIFFRLMNQLQKIETKGTRLKGITKELIVGAGQKDFLRFIEQHSKKGSVRRFVSLLREVTFLNELEKSKFINTLTQKYFKEFQDEHKLKSDVHIDDLISQSKKKGVGIASQNAISRMQKELDRILEVEIPVNSREIGVAQEKGDLRENAEYKVAMEKQVILQASVSKLETELKELLPIVGAYIPKEKITLGSKIKLNDKQNKDLFVYSIMDKWDADIDNGIISYESPLGKALLNHKIGDIIHFGNDPNKQKLEVLEISNAVDHEGSLS